MSSFQRLFNSVDRFVQRIFFTVLYHCLQLLKMTVTYSDEIATAKFSTLFRLLLLRWRGSVIKLIWRDLLVYLTIFFAIHFLGKSLSAEHFENFKATVKRVSLYSEKIPISFILGFFVSNVMTRWWDQYMAIPWPYSMAVYVSSTIQGYDEIGRAMRRTIMRYVCLSLTMVFRVLSPRVKARFPKFGDLVDAGLLYKSELKIIEQMEVDYPGYSKNWVPIVWAASLVNRARAQGRIRDDFTVKTLIKELNRIRSSCGTLLNYNSICIPLVYVQVVTIAMYTYFIVALISQQYLGPESEENSVSYIPWNLEYFPLIITLQFIFYMGWLKAAETMINPFGGDDDDFEINSLIDRNMIMSYLIVDEMHNEHPELLKDQYWDEIPAKLPDRVEEPDRVNRDAGQKDIFDVDEPKERPKERKGVSYMVPLESVESAENSRTIIKQAASSELVPKLIIDSSYMRIANVELTQSILEREMERIRRKHLYKRREQKLRSNDSSSGEGSDQEASNQEV